MRQASERPGPHSPQSPQREPSLRAGRSEMSAVGAGRTLIVPTLAANPDPDQEAVTSLLDGDAELG